MRCYHGVTKGVTSFFLYLSAKMALVTPVTPVTPLFSIYRKNKKNMDFLILFFFILRYYFRRVTGVTVLLLRESLLIFMSAKILVSFDIFKRNFIVIDLHKSVFVFIYKRNVYAVNPCVSSVDLFLNGAFAVIVLPDSLVLHGP